MPSPNYISTPCGPLILEFLGHDDIASYDKEAGRPGSCLEDALRGNIHRETIPRFDKQFSEWVFSLTGVPRATNEKQTAIEQARGRAYNKPILESFPRYLNRVFAKVTPEMQRQIQEEALAQSRLFRISAAPATRLSPIEPKFLKRATSLLSQELSEINDRVSEMLAIVGEYPVTRDSDGKPELESMARLMQHVNNTILSRDD